MCVQAFSLASFNVSLIQANICYSPRHCEESSMEEKSLSHEINNNMEGAEPVAAVEKHNGPEKYTCSHCDITFGNCAIYAMHMGYHGYRNPFVCNMCGEECVDEVAFFCHIARAVHPWTAVVTIDIRTQIYTPFMYLCLFINSASMNYLTIIQNLRLTLQDLQLLWQSIFIQLVTSSILLPYTCIYTYSNAFKLCQ